MSSEIIFFIIVVFLCLDFVLERVLESLNSKHMSPVLPDSLKGIYEEKEYSRFQSYKRENGRLDSWSSGVGFVVMIVFLVAGGFGWYNSWVVSLTDSVVWQTILFVVGLSVVDVYKRQIVHLANPRLPFGGVGMSGIGKYHGKASFELFSNLRSVVKSFTFFDNHFRYAPYKHLNLLKKFM